LHQGRCLGPSAHCQEQSSLHQLCVGLPAQETQASRSTGPCTCSRNSMGLLSCDGSRAGACRAPRRLGRVFPTGFAVVQDANNYGRAQLFPCGPLIPHTGIRVRLGVAGSTIGARGAGVCVMGCGLSLQGKGDWGEVLISSGQHPREETLGCPDDPPPAEPAQAIFVNVSEDGRFCERDGVFVLGGTLP
jgi:hypothetical protein